MLDAVSELTEYRIRATRKEVLERVLPLARRQAIIVEADSKGADEKITDDLNEVLDHLVNRGNRYLPFMYNYFDGASGSYRERRIWLVKTVFTDQGGETLFSLIAEGYAADFGLHETGALNAAAIGNLRIKLPSIGENRNPLTAGRETIPENAFVQGRKTILAPRNETAWEPTKMAAFAHTLRIRRELRITVSMNAHLKSRETREDPILGVMKMDRNQQQAL